MDSTHIILGSVWFGTTGIVLMNNGYEDKAYIGTSTGIDLREDEEYVAQYGLPFPITSAQQLIAGKKNKNGCPLDSCDCITNAKCGCVCHNYEKLSNG